MRSPAGALIARPWFDTLALRVIVGHYLPLSRAWAAARVADRSVERFLAEVPLADPPAAARDRLATALAAVARLDRMAADAERRWQEAAFGTARAAGPALAEAERARRAAAHALMAGRTHFMSLRRGARLPAVRYAPAGPDAVAARYGAALAAPERAYAPPAPPPEIAESASFAHAGLREYWLRFAAPSEAMADTVYARVCEPADARDPPTLIFGHGLFVEPEHWRGMFSFARSSCADGVRVVELETPWHGRRTPPSAYGGERLIATAPMGALDLFTAAAREIAVLVAWCRATSRGAVAVGGLSLGGLVAQLVGVRAGAWPAAMRPDALLVLTACDRIDRVVLEGSLGRALALPRALKGAGWTPEALARLRPLTDPVGTPAVSPERIVVALGSRDDLTPYAFGAAMAARWGVPRDNLFVRRQGHFSAALGLLRDPAPLRRLAALLARGT